MFPTGKLLQTTSRLFMSTCRMVVVQRLCFIPYQQGGKIKKTLPSGSNSFIKKELCDKSQGYSSGMCYVAMPEVALKHYKEYGIFKTEPLR